MPRDAPRHLRQTHDQLHFLARVPVRLQTPLDSSDIMTRGPSDLLGTFDDACIAGKQGGKNGRDEVVEGVVPGDAG